MEVDVRARFVGVDLAWSTGRTGVAALDGDGALLSLRRCEPGDDVEGVLRGLGAGVEVVAVDAPLIVGNDTGQRGAEREIGRTWGAFGASAHATNRGTQGEVTRAGRLADALGWDVRPTSRPGRGPVCCIEVYPHPALVGLFELPYRIAYKKGSAAARLPGFRQLIGLLEEHPALRLGGSVRWQEIRDVVMGEPGSGELDRVEDEVDAVVCALVALLWAQRPELLAVYGDGDEGYVVAPPAPRHAAVRPLASSQTAAARAGAREQRWVEGRPTGYGGSANERAWKAAVREAFVGVVMPEGSRVAVTIDVRLQDDQVGRLEPDLDNLVKTTIDALDGVLGARTGTAGQRLEADDVRVARLGASKEAAAGRPAGALVVVEEIVV
ncbi:DUF429 domain-containing protein [Pseudokineococcus sp. 5B2Z-1]|uniref:DUF429 domain-containing protein n=1 Tax=Pseudokineococcus sp. 5B2Z-1 TaxID=3132744 RepID=UPI0030A0F8A8